MATIFDILAKAFELQNAGKLRQAEQLYRQALAVEPNHAHALNNLGMLANQAGKPDEAIEYLRRALAADPTVAEFHSNLAVAYHAVLDISGAIAEYREALRLKPTAAHIHVAMGQLLLELGFLDEAHAHGREALRLLPGLPTAYTLLGAIDGPSRYALSEEDIGQIQALLQRGGLAIEQAAGLNYTMAAIWEKQSNFDEAFRCYRQANDLKRELFRQGGRRFDRRIHRDRIDTLIAAFTPDFFQRSRSFGVDSERPVFVVGMIRSGTSLVEQIVGNHPQVFGCGELHDMEQIATTFYPAWMTGLDVATVHDLANRYLQRLTRLGGSEAIRVIDKMPHNILHLGMIAVLFPRARVIHCRRDPMDVCVSAYTQNFQHLPYSTSLEDLGFCYREYERLVEHWRRVLPLRMYEVVYEELVAEQERITRELIAFCGLPWDERCLEFHTNPRAVKTASKLQVRQPMYTHAVAKWKRYEAHLQPLRDALAGR